MDHINSRMQKENYIPLGSTDIMISPIGIGTWAWGDSMIWGFGRDGYTASDLQSAFDTSTMAGVNFFDTAEIYGRGRSETFLGEFSQKSTSEVVIATKFFPYPWRLTRAQMVQAVQRSIQRLGVDQIDLYQIHWPYPPRSIDVWISGLVQVAKSGLTRTVGVSNYSHQQMHRAHKVLASNGVPLASNQVPYSLLDRKVEFNGLLQTCHELGISLIAYSPLAMGMLTGKYTIDNSPPGVRRWMYRSKVRSLEPIIALMREIGEDEGHKTPAQVAINWVICKGAIPIPGAKNIHQARENVGALGWRLSPEAVSALDKMSQRILHEPAN